MNILPYFKIAQTKHAPVIVNLCDYSPFPFAQPSARGDGMGFCPNVQSAPSLDAWRKMHNMPVSTDIYSPISVLSNPTGIKS
jgi:hypothetical protein